MKRAQVSYTSENLAVNDFTGELWKRCPAIELNLYWSGIRAEDARHSEIRMAWTDDALLVKFAGTQREPLVVNSKPETDGKSIGLWQRDVFEIFIAPDISDINHYFEFEVAPTGEWLDLEMRILPNGERRENFEYNSKMQSAAFISDEEVSAIIKIPWKAFGKKPQAGDIWQGNLFRCVGSGKTRGYLAWQPTETETPNFHVPEEFGFFEFIR